MLDVKTVIGSVRGTTDRISGVIPRDPMETNLTRSNSTARMHVPNSLMNVVVRPDQILIVATETILPSEPEMQTVIVIGLTSENLGEKNIVTARERTEGLITRSNSTVKVSCNLNNVYENKSICYIIWFNN